MHWNLVIKNKHPIDSNRNEIMGDESRDTNHNDDCNLRVFSKLVSQSFESAMFLLLQDDIFFTTDPFYIQVL